MEDTVPCWRYGTTSGIKKIGMHDRSENGHYAVVTLCARLTHIHLFMTGTDQNEIRS